MGASKFFVKRLTISLGRATYTDLSGNQPIQQSYNLRMDHAVFKNVSDFGDIVEIVTETAIRQMGLNKILDDAIARFGFFRPETKGLLGRAAAVLKENL